MTDFRALCAELLDEFVYHTDWSDAEELKDRARAALAAAPESAVKQSLTTAPPAPLEGEVAELVAALRQEADACFQLKSCGYVEWASRLTRAADLLRRLSPPQPVPVSERPWEREGWCDKRGMCWAWNWGICNWWEWVDSKLISYSSGDYTHCLPAHALPIPQQQENTND